MLPLEETKAVLPVTICCVETQEVFKSLHEAAEKIGISTAAISHVLHGRTKTAGGYQWKFGAAATA